MQGYQIATRPSSGGCHLIRLHTTSCTGGTASVWSNAPAVPDSPGYVRHLRPYPSSHRSRRSS